MNARRALTVAGIVASLAAVVSFGCRGRGLAASADAAVVTPTGVPTVGAPAQPVTGPNGRVVGAMPSLAPLVKTLMPLVVNIYTTENIRVHGGLVPQMPGGNNFFAPFFGFSPDRELKRQALGSGFSIGHGLILTNNHVIAGADVIRVKLADGREVHAKVVGRDPLTDIGVLRLEGKNVDDLPAARLGDSDAAEVGDYVIAIGEPFGLSATVTAGILSAKGRVIGEGPYDDFLQTDASINPGNSGGPLFDLRGEVIGINTAILAHGQGIGFAVPINMVKALLPQIEKTGHVARGWLGVGIQQITPALAKNFGLKTEKGALIAQVFPDGPAAKAGLQSGDVVTALDGAPITSPDQLSRKIAAVPPGKRVTLRILRNGKERTLRVKLAERDESAIAQGNMEGQSPQSEQEARARVGLTVSSITPDLAQRLGVRPGEGVVVTNVEPGSAADTAGVQDGDVLTELQRKPTNSVDAYRNIARTVEPGESVLFRVRRGGSAIYLAAQAPKK